MQYEYKILYHDELQKEFKAEGPDAGGDMRQFLLGRLNDLGRDGWELVSTATGDWQILGSGGTIKMSYFFKRLTNQENTDEPN